MSASSANRLQGNLSALRKSSQADLHMKIINIVASRMNPINSKFTQDKQICGSCVSQVPMIDLSKKNSIAGGRNKQGKSKCNITTPSGSQHDNKKQAQHGQITQSTSLTRKTRLQITNKVIQLNIQSPLSKKIQSTQQQQQQIYILNLEVMNKLKLQNAQKSKRIRNLQREVEQLYERIIELNLNLQIKSKLYPDQMPVSNSINRISSIHDTHLNQSKQVTKAWIEFDGDCMKRGSEHRNWEQNGGEKYEHLLRILKTQAVELQNSIRYMSSTNQKSYDDDDLL